jgi:predicted ATPase/class 3 adenylate cyclase
LSGLPNFARSQTQPIPSGTVAFLFTDIEGSMQRWERFREEMAAAVKRHDGIVRGAIESQGGYVFKTIGDAFCAAFPTVRDAAAAALDAQRAVSAEDFSGVDALKVRMALHVGHADERDGDYFGPTVNRVARLLAVGYGGQVLVSGAAADLVQDELPAQATLRDLGAHRLKDLTQPEQIYQLVAPDLQQQFFALKSLEALPNNLPLQVTSFVGREHDIAEIADLMGRTRLLTLVGTGGVGKTRLALQIGADLLDRHPDGVWYVELAPLVDAALIPNTVASLFGVSEQPQRTLTDAIVSALRNRTALLIFDNCEHLVAGAAAMVDAIIRGCANVRIIATSREGLGIGGETVHRVASLALPETGLSPNAETARGYGAIALFEERAAAANTRFSLTDTNAPVVAEICGRLDGIALAIELAATRIKVLSVEQLAAKLDERFRLLTGGSRTALPRQQTMRALIDWSYDLLAGNERTVFRRVAVFAGGWTLEAAGEVCSDDSIESWDVLDLMSALVDKSMIVAELGDSEQRYRLLESTRQYALEKLSESGEREHLRDTHARYTFALAHRAVEDMSRTPLGTWMTALAPEIDNFRLALDWLLTERHDVERGAELVSLLHEYFLEMSRPAEFWRWAEAALEAVGADGDPKLRAPLLREMAETSSALGKGLTQRRNLAREASELYRIANDRKGMGLANMTLGSQLAFFGEIEEARPLLSDALEIARESGDRRFIAQCLALTAWTPGASLPERRERMQEAIAIFRTAGDERRVAHTLSWLAEHEFAAGETDRALECATQSIAIMRRRRFRTNLIVQLMNSAAYNLWIGNVEAARTAARESIGLCQEVQDILDVPICIQHLASVADAAGDSRSAARLAGFVNARLVQIDEPRQPTEQRLYDRLMTSLAEKLSGAQIAQLQNEGAQYSEDRAIDEALAI